MRIIQEKSKSQSSKALKKKMKFAVFRTGTPRWGWNEAYRKMTKHGDDVLLDMGNPANLWTLRHWEW